MQTDANLPLCFSVTIKLCHGIKSQVIVRAAEIHRGLHCVLFRCCGLMSRANHRALFPRHSSVLGLKQTFVLFSVERRKDKTGRSENGRPNIRHFHEKVKRGRDRHTLIDRIALAGGKQ